MQGLCQQVLAGLGGCDVCVCVHGSCSALMEGRLRGMHDFCLQTPTSPRCKPPSHMFSQRAMYSLSSARCFSAAMLIVRGRIDGRGVWQGSRRLAQMGRCALGLSSEWEQRNDAMHQACAALHWPHRMDCMPLFCCRVWKCHVGNVACVIPVDALART